MTTDEFQAIFANYEDDIVLMMHHTRKAAFWEQQAMKYLSYIGKRSGGQGGTPVQFCTELSSACAKAQRRVQLRDQLVGTAWRAGEL